MLITGGFAAEQLVQTRKAQLSQDTPYALAQQADTTVTLRCF